MKIKSGFICLIVFFALPHSSLAQGCLDETFESTTRKTVVYLEKPGEKLAMDIIAPANDTERNRPVVLYVHGGEFRLLHIVKKNAGNCNNASAVLPSECGR